VETGRFGTVFASTQFGSCRYWVGVTRPVATGRLAGPAADPAHRHRNPSDRPPGHLHLLTFHLAQSQFSCPPRACGRPRRPEWPCRGIGATDRPANGEQWAGPCRRTPTVTGQHRGPAPALADHAVRRQRAGSGPGIPARRGVVAAGTAGRSHRRPARAPTQQYLLLGDGAHRLHLGPRAGHRNAAAGGDRLPGGPRCDIPVLHAHRLAACRRS